MVLNAEIHSAAYISIQYQIINTLDPNPDRKRSSSSGTSKMVTLWNCLTVKQSVVNYFPMAFPWIGSLSLSASIQVMPHRWGDLKASDSLTKERQWWSQYRFEIKNEIGGQDESSPKSIENLTVQWCLFGPHFAIQWCWVMAWTRSKWGKFWILSSIWP